jgi:putative ABC transport system permease protein
VLDQETSPRTTQARVLGLFAAVAFLLAGIGIHGLLSFAVSHRAQEIGVRMAMGAQVGDILRMILGESLILASIGTSPAACWPTSPRAAWKRCSPASARAIR